jgi:hypothetical protein
LTYPVRCLAADGVTQIYTALLANSGDPSKPALLRSRADLPEPFSTVLYRVLSGDQRQIVFMSGALQFTESAYADDPTPEFLDGFSFPVIGPGKRGSSYESCDELDRDFGACLGTNLWDSGVTPKCVQCGKEFGSCYRNHSALGFMVCMAQQEKSSVASCVQCLPATVSSLFNCVHPFGQQCRTSGCYRGMCVDEIDPTANARFLCAPDIPQVYLCDLTCESCDPQYGCLSGCEDCHPCQNGQCQQDQTIIPFNAIRWAKMSVDASNAEACHCSGGLCSCNAGWNAEMKYYACNPLHLVSTCSGSASFAKGRLPNCNFIYCNPLTYKSTAWNKVNTCTSGCSGPVNACASGTPPVFGPVAGPIDLRTEPERRLKNCCSMPP